MGPALAAWFGAYIELGNVASWLTYDVLSLQRHTHLGGSVAFFLTDVPKIFLLLGGIIPVVSVIRSYFPPERVKKVVAGRSEFAGTVLAALLGTLTPFCSCSAVPMFIGFVESGLPLGVTFAFLIASPVVNEVALVLLAGLFGIKIALIYIGLGLVVAVAGGTVIGRLHLEREIEDYVLKIKLGESAAVSVAWDRRVSDALSYTKEILRRVFPWVIGGIVFGAAIHGYAPTGFVAQYAGRGNPFAVPMVVLIAVPLYSNAAGTIPIVQALIQKGLPMGTTLAFMMAITAISAPEMVILRKVIKPKLIAIFVGVVTVAIIMIGYVFNALL
ncbi:MAG TPA: permease [Acidimicrobiales bacterium]|nr:permease [Acidimicrobiales bacterium]